MLSRGVVLRTFARSKATKRNPGSGTVSIQLLQDVQNIGSAGEILKVKAGFMRNFLHRNNKACYITATQGPKIPVVVAAPKVDLQKKKKEAAIVKEAIITDSAPAALSLEELSSLFSNMRKKTNSAGSAVAAKFESTASDVQFSLVELEENLPSTFNFSAQNYPVGTDALSAAIFNSTGIEVPASAILLRSASGEVLKEVSVAGDYTWTFQAQGDDKSIRRTLRVQ